MNIQYHIINTCLLSQNALMLALQADPDIFTGPARKMLDLLRDLNDGNADVDLAYFLLQARDRGLEKKCDLDGLMRECASASPLVNFAGVLEGLERQKRREFLRAAAVDLHVAIDKKELELDEYVEKIIDLAERKTANVSHDIREYVKQPLDEITRKQKFLRTGFHCLDKTLVGLFYGQMTVIAGAPGMGKTTLASQICLNVLRATEYELPVLFISTETKKRDWYIRLLSCQTGIEFKEIIHLNDLPPGLKAKVIDQHKENEKLNIVFYDETSDFNTMYPFIKKMCKYNKPALVVVDYIQRLRISGKRSENEELTYISNKLKDIAFDFDLPLLAASQLSRDSRKTGRTPDLIDLRGSGTIEQDSGSVLLLYETEADGFNINVAKNRFGRTGKVNGQFKEINFRKEYYRFEEIYEGADV